VAGQCHNTFQALHDEDKDAHGPTPMHQGVGAGREGPENRLGR
jgi:hypothetical protein